MRKHWTKAEKTAARHYSRARSYGSDTDFSAAALQVLFWWFGGVCLCCGTADDLTIDHVMPLSRGGSNSITNIAVLCGRCNSSKSTRTVDYRDLHQLVQVLELLQ